MYTYLNCISSERHPGLGGGWLLLFILCGPWMAQASESSTSFSGYLLELGLPSEAANDINRRRVVEGLEADGTTLLAVADAFAAKGRTARAIAFYEQAYGVLQGTSEGENAALVWAGFLLKQGDTAAASGLLSRLEAFGVDGESRRAAGKLLCVANILAEEGEVASRCLEQQGVLSAMAPSKKGQVLALLDVLRPTPLWQPVAGAAASAILPGLGQALGGEPLDGLNALGINGAWMAIAGSLLRAGYGIEAGLFTLSMAMKYYVPNVKRGYQIQLEAAGRRRHGALDLLLPLLE